MQALEIQLPDTINSDMQDLEMPKIISNTFTDKL